MARQTNIYKTIAKIIVWIGMSSFCLFGCSKQPKEAIDQTGIIQEQGNGYYFIYDGMEIKIDMPAKEVLEQLGEYKTYFEAQSCAIDSMIRTYGYGNFEIDTYELDGTEYISSIFFKDDTVMTKEGAFLFMSRDRLFYLYGEDCVEEAGMMVFYKDKMKLKFLISNDEVISIQYASLVTEVKQ